MSSRAFPWWHVPLTSVLPRLSPPLPCSLQEETTPEASGQQYLDCMTRVAAVFGRLQSALTLLAKQGNSGDRTQRAGSSMM